MSNKNEYLPCKCWFEKGELHRAYFEYDEDCYDSPRDWDNLSIIVNASRYNLCGSNDVVTNDIEEWLIKETGIKEDWYYKNYKRYGGLDGLINKFQKEKCIAFTYLSVYDHSGICVYCGYERGWDTSAVGFAYVPKDSDEVKSYRRTSSLEETKKWANEVLESEIHTLDQYVRGDVYGVITEVYDEETKEWNREESLWDIYLDSKSEEDSAISYIKEYSGDAELLDEKVVLEAIENNTLDVLQGQNVLVFKEIE